MSKASMARAIAKAGKKQEAQTRGLTGNRNAQGDFITGENKLDTDRFAASEMIARDNTVDAVTPDLQNYIEDVKAQIDEIDARYEELYNAEHQGAEDVSGSLVKEMEVLKAQKKKLVDELIITLEEEGIPVPDEVRDLQPDGYKSVSIPF